MTKKQAIESLRSARREMKADPGLEEVDTLSVMEVAIADAWQYLTSRQAKSRKLDVNTHDALLSALKAAYTALAESDAWQNMGEEDDNLSVKIREAIAKAEEYKR